MGINYSNIPPSDLPPEDFIKVACLNPFLEKLRLTSKAGSCGNLFFTAPDSFKLHYRVWPENPKEDVQSVVLCLHGFHSHGEKFVLLADFFADFNWATYALDLRGHGLSWMKSDDQGDIEDYSLWIKDLSAFLQFLHSRHPRALIHLIAESMGAALSIHAAMNRPSNLRSLILLSPALKISKPVEFTTLLASLTFSAIGSAEKALIPNPGRSRMSTNREAYLEYEVHDSLRMPRASPRYTYQVVKMIHQLKELNPGKFYPTLVFYGGDDHLVEFSGAEELIIRIKNRNKSLQFIPGAAHELLTDVHAIEYGIYEKIVDWMARACSIE